MTPLLEVVDAIFFDCDGVLIDSVHVKERQFRAMMEERIPKHADAAMDYYWANGGTSRLAKFRWIWTNLVGLPLTEPEVEALGREFQSRVFAGVVACPMLPGAKEFLERCSAALPFFVISGTPDDELKRVIEARGLQRYFREVCGSPRTKTEIGRDLLEGYGFDPKRVWVVGDATTDLEAARNLGLHFVGIDGPHLTPFVGPGERLIKDLTTLEQAILASRS
jgi:phosphoglycolate phosphatase-like HAD superfamily hydrolase